MGGQGKDESKLGSTMSSRREGQINTLLALQELNYAKKGIAMGLLAGITWGLDGVLMGLVLALLPVTGQAGMFLVPLVGGCLHDGFAAAWLFGRNVVSGKWRDYWRTLKTRPGKIVMAAALLGGPIGMGANLLAIYFAGASYAAAITAAYPALGAALGGIFLKEKVTVRVWCGIGLAVLGSFLVGYVPPDTGKYPDFYLGIGLAAVAALGWALEGVLATFGMDLVDSDIASGIRQCTSFAVYVLAVFPLLGSGSYTLLLALLTTSVAWYMAGIALVGAASFLFWYRAMNMTGVARAMGLNVTYALWSVFFSWLLNSLTITPGLLGGVVVISIGTVLTIGNPRDLVNLRSK